MSSTSGLAEAKAKKKKTATKTRSSRSALDTILATDKTCGRCDYATLIEKSKAKVYFKCDKKDNPDSLIFYGACICCDGPFIYNKAQLEAMQQEIIEPEPEVEEEVEEETEENELQ